MQYEYGKSQSLFIFKSFRFAVLASTKYTSLGRFGIDQEYTLLKKEVNWPIGWPTDGYPGRQDPYYCGIGVDKAFGRDIVDAHYKACLYARINISGINGDLMRRQMLLLISAPSGGITTVHPWQKNT
ncbi:hypothetical protein ACET3Z_007363 [Daucus carota]